jgi:hypothetical protein
VNGPNWTLLLAVLLPIAVLQWGLNIAALLDLVRRNPVDVRHLPKWGWAVFILTVGFVGSIAYLVAGREET